MWAMSPALFAQSLWLAPSAHLAHNSEEASSLS